MESIIEEENLNNDNELLSLELPESIKIYIDDITKYPLLSIEETIELFSLSKKGNKEAREKLINSNLRLVIKPAYKRSRNLTHLDVLDLIQAGNEGLIKAIDKFNPSLGIALSTYAMSYIDGYILRSINTTERSIHRSEHLNSLITQYLKLVKKYKENNEFLPDELIEDILDITPQKLKEIRTALTQTETSLNAKIDNSDKDSKEKEDFIKTYESGYSKVLNAMSDNELLIILKESLSSIEYFILYYRIISDPNKTLQVLADELGLSREMIRIYEKSIKKKIRPFLEANSKTYKREKESILKREGKKFRRIKVLPLTPDNIITFLYLKEQLTELETNILYSILIEKYTYTEEELARKNGISINLLLEKLSILREKRNALRGVEKESYLSFKKVLLDAYHSNIYKIDLKSNKEEYLNYYYLLQKYGNLKIEELRELCGDDIFYSLDPKLLKVLERFLGSNSDKNIHARNIEEQINRIIFGYKRKNTKVIPNELYKVFKKNFDKFTEEQILYLECYYFNKKNRSEFNRKYPNSKLALEFLEEKLEKLYFSLYNYFWHKLTKKEYLKVKKRYKNLISEERIKLLDLHYGIEGKPLTFREISELTGLSLEQVTNKIRNAKNYCSNLLNKRTKKNQINKNTYKKYILDKKYTLTDETRIILKYHIIEGKTYEEISKITGLTKNRIANIVIDGIRRIDMYRFMMITPDTLTWKEEDEFYKEYSSILSEQDKQITELRFVENLTIDKISEILKLNKTKVNTKIKRLASLIRSFKIKNIDITITDIESEIKRHQSESILDEFEKTILSLYYGIKSNYNQDEKKLTSNDICNKQDISINIFHHTHKHAIDKLKLLKIGELRPNLIYISRENLNKHLEDPNLPITKEERELICQLLELKDYEYIPLEKFDKNTRTNLKRKYERAILKIYKYLNGEIEEKLDYDSNIKPILKYFSKSDRIFIIDYFKNGLSYNEISKKYRISFDKIVGIFDRILNDITGILTDKYYKKFDYDFYEEAISNKNLPFYGDLKLATKIFDLFVGNTELNRISAPEIIEVLNLDIDAQTVIRIVYNLMISACKLKNGITKENSFSIEEVKEYYEKNKNNMSEHHKKFYLRYFRNLKTRRRTFMPKEIVFDLMEEQIPNLFRVKTATKEFVGGVLKTHYNEIGSKTREALMELFDIQEREFMNGKEKLHAYHALHLIDRRIKMRDEENKRSENNNEKGNTLTLTNVPK